MLKRLLVISAPSGGGKSTIARFILEKYEKFTFSVSATTRKMREGEVNGVNYYFIDKEEFITKIQNDEFIEHEQLFDNYYGTLKSTINDLLDAGKNVLFDIDVKGALSIKKIFGEKALLLFIMPPSLEVLEARLRNRKSETDEQIRTRLSRYQEEMSMIDSFDVKVVNDVLEVAINEVDEIIKSNFPLE